MFDFSTPWWELIVRALAIYFFLLLALRLMGKRQVGELAPFDFVVLLLLSDALQNSMVGEDKSLPGGMIVAGTMLLVDRGLTCLSFRFKKVDDFLEGVPQVLISDGKKCRKSIESERITDKELMAALREHDCEGISDVKLAILETNGDITVIPKKEK
ncbi:MAG: DUF421 domain-containing protein [Bdellovibrionaceae bacterium]|nr:DUF421 domain-containing protein [Pseudobdellovibrionaceae bacterium]MBX3032321.1 DUF421 domain-containing protein [Pseudobdellovibrionaceae bacterium]